MKKFNVVIIVVMCIMFLNSIYASQNAQIDVSTNKNKVVRNDKVQIKVILKNLDDDIYVKNICGYIDYDKAVFENVTNNDIRINNRIFKDSYNENSRKIFTNTTLKLGENINILTINLKVKDNVKVGSGYVSLKQFYIMDENYNKIEFSEKNIKFSISNNYSNTNNASIGNPFTAISDTISANGIMDTMKDKFNIPILDNFSKVLSIPLEGTWIIVYSFLAVILFRILVVIMYKGGVSFTQRLKRMGQIRRMDKIFKSINSKIVE